jgi:hypothetical protein
MWRSVALRGVLNRPFLTQPRRTPLGSSWQFNLAFPGIPWQVFTLLSCPSTLRKGRKGGPLVSQYEPQKSPYTKPPANPSSAQSEDAFECSKVYPAQFFLPKNLVPRRRFGTLWLQSFLTQADDDIIPLPSSHSP